MARALGFVAVLLFVGCDDCQDVADVISAEGSTWRRCDSNQKMEVKPVDGGVLVTCRCTKK